MESNSLEFKIQCCKDLKAFNFFQKLLVYARISMVSQDPTKKLDNNQQQRTPTDKEGDGNPEWNHQVRLDLHEISLQDSDHLFVQFHLFHEGVMFGDKPIGEVRVPISDLVDDLSGVTRFVSYQVQIDGKPNGVLSFSYKVNGKGEKIRARFSGSEGISGFPVFHDQLPDNLYPTSEIHTSAIHEWNPVPESSNSYQSTQEVNSSSPPYPPPPHQLGYYPQPPHMIHGGFPHHPHPHPHHHHLHHRHHYHGSHSWRPDFYGYDDYNVNMMSPGRGGGGPPNGYQR